jgi:hypothetical protein
MGEGIPAGGAAGQPVAAHKQLPPPLPLGGNPAGWNAWRLRLLGGTVAAGLLTIIGFVFRLYPSDLDQKLKDLKGGVSEARRNAVVALAETDIDDAHRDQVTTALEPFLFDGDIRHDLNPDIVLRAYLHWAGPDNVPAMLRMVESSTLPDWDPKKTRLVILALGKLQDQRAVAVLAEKLADPALHDQAVDALRLMGPKAQNAVMDYAFDSNSATRVGASQLLEEFGTKPTRIGGEALARLKSNDPDAQLSAAVWFANNPPGYQAPQGEAAKGLVSLLDSLSPNVEALVLRALKLWATKDCLPELVAFAKRQENNGPCSPELIDVLARFPDETAADAIARRLKDPANRARAAQALAKLGPVATRVVLGYINDPDAEVRKEAQGLCYLLNIPAALQLEQTLADVADPWKARCRVALQDLAQARPDEASRLTVSRALNAPLLDADGGVRADALAAVRTWGTRDNTATLLNLLDKFPDRGPSRNPWVIDILGSLQDPAAASALAEGLTHPQDIDPAVKALTVMGPAAEQAVIPYLQSSAREARYAACWVLGEIGTPKSLSPLEAAARKCSMDADFFQRTQLASEKIMARNS